MRIAIDFLQSTLREAQQRWGELTRQIEFAITERKHIEQRVSDLEDALERLKGE